MSNKSRRKKSLVGFIDPNFIDTSLGFRNTFIRIKPPITKQCMYLRQARVRVTVEQIEE